MDQYSVLEILVTIWGVAMAVSPSLQIRQMFHTGQSDDVSIGYFCVLTVGFLLWVAYGISIGSTILWLCNAIASIFGIATVMIALKLRIRTM